MLHLLSHNKIFYRLNIIELSVLRNVTANDLETSYILFAVIYELVGCDIKLVFVPLELLILPNKSVFKFL